MMAANRKQSSTITVVYVNRVLMEPFGRRLISSLLTKRYFISRVVNPLEQWIVVTNCGTAAVTGLSAVSPDFIKNVGSH